MNWHNIMLKMADVRFFYHGTAAANIPMILSQGLHIQNKKTRVWNEQSGKRSNGKNLESYPGIYLTENFGTASGAAGRSGRHLEGRNSGYVNKGIVMCRIETRTPHLTVDEDWIKDPEHYFSAVQKGILFDGYALYGWIQSGFQSIEKMSYEMLKGYLYRDNEAEWNQKVAENERFIQAMMPYNIEYIKAYSMWKAAVSLSGSGNSAFGPASHFPELATLNRDDEEQKMRKAALIFLDKAHRLTTLRDDHGYSNNVRYAKELGYSGSNRIVLVATVQDYDWNTAKAKGYHRDVKINYCGDQTALSKFIAEMREREGEHMKVISQNGQVIYDEPMKPEPQEEPATTQTPPAAQLDVAPEITPEPLMEDQSSSPSSNSSL